jgi:hypothetical protein
MSRNFPNRELPQLGDFSLLSPLPSRYSHALRQSVDQILLRAEDPIHLPLPLSSTLGRSAMGTPA